MKYRKLTGFILKKQNYHESNQIVTIWTRETGKIRFLARSVRLNKSKLGYNLQDFSLVEIELAGNRSLPTVISVQPVNHFKVIKKDLTRIGPAFYACELMLKMTADEHPNPEAFDCLQDFFNFLDQKDVLPARQYQALEVFTLNLLQSLGFGIRLHSEFPVPADLKLHLDSLQKAGFADLERLNHSWEITGQLHEVIRRFVEFILERNLRSESFLLNTAGN